MGTKKRDRRYFARTLRKMADKKLGLRPSYNPPPPGNVITDLFLEPYATLLADAEKRKSMFPAELWSM